MTTVNKSLSYIDNTLVYNNEYELYLPPEVLPENSVRIGNQIWSTKNLDINDGGYGISMWNFDYWGPFNVGIQYYYTWEAAERVVANIDGWHIPTKAEWQELIAYCGGEESGAVKIKSTFGWYTNNGTDDYGFNAIPIGQWDNQHNVVERSTKFVAYRVKTSSPRNLIDLQVRDSNAFAFLQTISPESQTPLNARRAVRLIKDA